MKKVLAMGLAVVMSFAVLAGCGGTENGASGESADVVKGEVYDAGNVSVLVPEGWMAIPVDDIWSEDEEATDPDQIQVCKDAESDIDILLKPYVHVVYYDESTDMMQPSSDWYDDVEELEPITAGDKTWEGFKASSIGLPFATLWTGEAGGDQFQATIWLETDELSISLDDADVMAILESIQPTA